MNFIQYIVLFFIGDIDPNNKPIEKKKTIVPKNTPWRKFKINTRI